VAAARRSEGGAHLDRQRAGAPGRGAQRFQDARIAPTRARFIAGRAADVLPRMNEAAYDIVLVDADPENVIEYVEHGLRLVRAGGTVLVPRVLAGGRVADPVQRDDVTVAYRSLIQETQQSPAVLAALSTAARGCCSSPVSSERRPRAGRRPGMTKARRTRAFRRSCGTQAAATTLLSTS
jgi:hypothetical protein